MIKITAADRWFSWCVRERAGWRCERCGQHHPPPTAALHCAHYCSRGHWATRFDPSNATAQCMGCHLYLQAHPDEHRWLVLDLIGEAELEALRARASRPAHGIRRRVAEIARHYAAEYRRLAARTPGSGRPQIRAWTPGP